MLRDSRSSGVTNARRDRDRDTAELSKHTHDRCKLPLSIYYYVAPTVRYVGNKSLGPAPPPESCSNSVLERQKQTTSSSPPHSTSTNSSRQQTQRMHRHTIDQYTETSFARRAPRAGGERGARTPRLSPSAHARSRALSADEPAAAPCCETGRTSDCLYRGERCTSYTAARWPRSTTDRNHNRVAPIRDALSPGRPLGRWGRGLSGALAPASLMRAHRARPRMHTLPPHHKAIMRKRREVAAPTAPTADETRR